MELYLQLREATVLVRHLEGEALDHGLLDLTHAQQRLLLPGGYLLLDPVWVCVILQDAAELLQIGCQVCNGLLPSSLHEENMLSFC